MEVKILIRYPIWVFLGPISWTSMTRVLEIELELSFLKYRHVVHHFFTNWMHIPKSNTKMIKNEILKVFVVF